MILPKEYRLKSYVCVSTLVVCIVTFNVAFLIAYSVNQKIIENQARIMSLSVSRQTVHELAQLMKNGWTKRKLDNYISFMDGTDGGAEYKIKLYGRSGSKIDGNIARVLNSGSIMNAKNGFVLTNIYPIKAERDCLKCHRREHTGSIMGATSVQLDIGPAINGIKKKFTFFFMVLSPLPFVIAGFIASFLNAKIKRSMESFHEKIKNVSSIGDLTKLEMKISDGAGFTEFNTILRELDDFAKRIRNVAVDKDILEFEFQVLEKFIITAETVKDWKEHVHNLLIEINKVIEAHTLFTIFQVEDDLYDLEVFWTFTPSDDIKKFIEKIVHLNAFGINENFAHSVIKHNLPHGPCATLDLSEDDLDLQTKSVTLQNPKIRGVIGIGLRPEFMKNPVRSLVIDGILTTISNVAGSITAIHKYTKDLEYYATRDPLTHLYNQRLFWELLRYEIMRSDRLGYKLSVVVIDLDNFKNINDSHGHVFGDRFLLEIANMMHCALRKGDILARYGGDEFTIVLPDADEEQAFLVANRIKENMGSISLPSHDGAIVKVTASIGFSVYPVHASNAKDLFTFADNMMYKAKKEGKDTIVIPTPEDVAKVFTTTGEVDVAVINAIEQKSGIPYFQPILDLETGRYKGHEVLSRIKTDSGIMTASEFIGVAERIGMVDRLDHMLMEKAFGKVKTEGYKGSLFINLSPKSLIIKDFIPGVINLTRKYGIDPNTIVFEITERDTVKNISLLKKFIFDLKSEGFNFAIDDFGSGFSSFQYVKHFPIDYAKIDGEFIKNMIADSKDIALVKSMVVLCREFGIRTVAECVENEEILDAVRQVGIAYCQGYHIGMPSPDLKI